MASDQTLSVKWGLSLVFSVNNGIGQGDILSPLLFNVNINDLSRLLLNELPMGNCCCEKWSIVEVC